ncbi:MAG: M48 family metallopeptidase [Lachnospiraceae bacterium]|nr:M48 family metallopeptidase [Lachnospiraceae bacterium]
MNFKVLALVMIGVMFVFDIVLKYLDVKSTDRETPDNVKDLFNPEEYKTWMAYHKEKCKLSFSRIFVSNIVTLLVIGFDVYALLLGVTGLSDDLYGAAVIVTLLDIVIGMIWSVPYSYIDNMKIEAKYGFNRMTNKTFVVDLVKEFIINACVMCGLICLFIVIHQAMGNLLLVVFTAIAMLILLVMVFLSPVLTRIFNKLTPLEEGELRDRLTKLLEDNNCSVSQISVTDGSRRSTKANAYFGGFGKMKTIVLYDTLIEQMTEDEIVAVFAHEMGHNKHKDTLKLYGMNIINISLMVFMAWALVSFPEIYTYFGFEGVNYGFAFILLGSVCMSFVSPLIGLFINAMSRKFEYKADQFAAENGYGEALISGLKKLHKNSFSNLNPHPLLVKMFYNHPTLSERIDAVTAYMEGENK